MDSSASAYLLPAELRNALMQYLGQRPFVEVAGAIASLQQLQKAPPPAAPTPVDHHPV